MLRWRSVVFRLEEGLAQTPQHGRLQFMVVQRASIPWKRLIYYPDRRIERRMKALKSAICVITHTKKYNSALFQPSTYKKKLLLRTIATVPGLLSCIFSLTCVYDSRQKKKKKKKRTDLKTQRWVIVEAIRKRKTP